MLRIPDTVGDDIVLSRVGLLAYYFGTTDPNGALICNGRTIKYSEYPLLVEHLNTVKQTGNPRGDVAIPDLRGYFLRGLGGNSSSIDKEQTDAIRNMTGEAGYGLEEGAFATGVFRLGRLGVGVPGSHADWSFSFDASRVVPTANENRPLNKAYNIVIFTGVMKKKSDTILNFIRFYTSKILKRR